MANPAGESNGGVLKLDFDRRLTVHFRGSVVTSDAGLLAYRELDDALGLTAMAGETLADARTGKNGRHALVGLLRQSVFGRLAGYEDVNDAERLRHDPAMRWIVGGKAAQGRAASPSQMGRFETQWLAAPANLSALAALSGQWIDLVHGRRPPRGIVLDMDSSVSPTHGEQEMSVWNGHYACTCYHPLFVFNQFGDLERCALRPGNVHSADGWDGVLKPSWRATRARSHASIFERTRPLQCQRSTSSWKPSGSNMRSACQPTGSSRTGSAICSSVRSDDLRTMCAGVMRASAIRPEAGASRAG
jgi:Transposase DDE domain group 1